MTTTIAVPELAPATEFTIPEYGERHLPNGLTVLAIHRPSVPIVEIRLRIPFAYADVAVASVMAQTLLSGTSTASVVDIAARVQAVGGGLAAGVDPDRLIIAGNSLRGGIGELLAVTADVLRDATYPADQVRVERERLVDRISVARQQPGHLVQRALLRRLYGEHPYSIQVPEPEDVATVTSEALLALHAERVHPVGATLVIVGDLPVDEALDAGEAALGAWNGGGEPLVLAPAPSPRTGPLGLVDRPESVQSSLRLALEAYPRTHDDNAAQQLANLIYGGYFSSRLVHNIRETKGYTYSPRSTVDHALAGSMIVIAADVATEVTAPALWEMRYELGRLAVTEPTSEELEQARRYALGTLRIGTATQAGLASLTSTFAGMGLRPDWLLDHARRLSAVSIEDVHRVAREIFAPAKAIAVVLGDEREIADEIRALDEVDILG
ncbi:M16 family metallopeptidase [Stackebrandtia soli]|uniref:M16 family metallopeptidase n=1 Tax=Stackebrandtia soli TaxID=1892856 RepID=UPI0039E8F302